MVNTIFKEIKPLFNSSTWNVCKIKMDKAILKLLLAYSPKLPLSIFKVSLRSNIVQNYSFLNQWAHCGRHPPLNVQNLGPDHQYATFELSVILGKFIQGNKCFENAFFDNFWSNFRVPTLFISQKCINMWINEVYDQHHKRKNNWKYCMVPTIRAILPKKA